MNYCSRTEDLQVNSNRQENLIYDEDRTDFYLEKLAYSKNDSGITY